MSKLDETMEQLQQGVEALRESEKFKEYLDTMSRFHNYSVNNCILIAMQKPEATRVASYSTWKNSFNRQVMKGEHGITIISPATVKKTVQVEMTTPDGRKMLGPDGTPLTEEKEVVKRVFQTAKVFDISQTEGDPLPEIVHELSNPVEHFEDYMDAIKELSPVPIRFDNINGEMHGFYSPTREEIVVKRGMAEEQTLKTLVHEIAHARLGHGSADDHFDRPTKEVQAESIAYACCRHLGLDTSDYSFGYIAGWSAGKDQQELKESLQVIRDQADEMIKGIEEKLEYILELRHESQKIEEPKIRHSMSMAM